MSLSRLEKINYIKEIHLTCLDEKKKSETYFMSRFNKTIDELDDFYIDVLYLLIKKDGLKIRYSEAHLSSPSHRDNGYNGTFNQYDFVICWDFVNKKTLIHELAHSLDMVFNKLTYNFIIEEFNKSFFFILLDELKTNFKLVLDELLNSLKERIIKNTHDEQMFSLIKSYLFFHSKLYTLDEKRVRCTCEVDKRSYFIKELEIYNYLVSNNYIENILSSFNSIQSNNRYIYINGDEFVNHQTLIDILSSIFNFKFLTEAYGHGPTYYEYRFELVGEEFFANLMSMYEPSSNTLKIDDELLIKYFPCSINAFKLIVNHLRKRINDDNLSFNEDDHLLYIPNSNVNNNDELYELDDEEEPIFDSLSYINEVIKKYLSNEQYEVLDDLLNKNDHSLYLLSKENKYRLTNKEMIKFYKKREEELLNAFKYNQGLDEAIKDNKQSNFNSLTQEEKKNLYCDISYILYIRSRDFRYMFKEKLKYLPNVYFNSFNYQSYSYETLFILNNQMNNKLRQLIINQYQKETSINKMDKESKLRIINCLNF